MPTYDYKCENCGHQFEILQKMTDDRLSSCPKCSQESLRRLIGTGGGILFKGNGFYQTDYRSESYTKSKAKESSKSDKKAADTKSSPTKSD